MPDFELALREALSTSSPAVAAAVGHLTRTSGKKFRPLLVRLAASLGSPSPRAVRDVAVAAELIHLASLVHDDILDEATCRRGHTTLHLLYGSGSATLVGDFLFSRAFCLLAPYAHLGVVGTMTEAIARMCEGELEQRAHRGDIGLSEEQYLEQASNKTAALIAACARAGAQVAHLPLAWQDHLYEYGRCLGCAFQIIDDILDFSGDASHLGKPVRRDVRHGVITLPLIYALADPFRGTELRGFLRETILTDTALTAACRLVAMSGGLERAASTARSFLKRARTHLRQLPLAPARISLQKLTYDLARTIPHPPAYGTPADSTAGSALATGGAPRQQAGQHRQSSTG